VSQIERIDEAIALVARSEIEKARAVATRLLAAAPDDPAALNTMGIVETGDQRHGEARRYYERAVALAPKNADYRVNLGYSKVLEGDFENARADFDAALALDPENVSAFQNIVWITKIRPGDPTIDQIRALSARAAEHSEDYIKLQYALGKCLDDIGDYDAAFAAYTRANGCQPCTYNHRQHEAFFQSVQSVWTKQRVERLRLFGSSGRKAAFIIGMPRSGSTLVEEKLSADPRVAGLGEAPDIIRMSGAIQRSHPRRAAFPDWCVDCPDTTYGGLAGIYLAKYEARFPGAKRLINKSLLNFAYAGMIAAMFPSGLIIETRRNAIDTCLSCYFKDLKPAHQYALRLDTLGHLYRLYDANMRHCSETLSNLVTVRYEDFIADVDGGVAALKDAMGLDDDAGHEGAAQPRHVQTISAWQVRQPIYRHAVERWRNYEKHIGPLIDALGDLAI
jgi:tetratricopeptide (TPR) repeat protein